MEKEAEAYWNGGRECTLDRRARVVDYGDAGRQAILAPGCFESFRRSKWLLSLPSLILLFQLGHGTRIARLAPRFRRRNLRPLS